MHILSPETDNCPSWISGRERMTVENISWSISTKECCRPRRGLNPRPPGLQSDGASNWATEAKYMCTCMIVYFTVLKKHLQYCVLVFRPIVHSYIRPFICLSAFLQTWCSAPLLDYYSVYCSELALLVCILHKSVSDRYWPDRKGIYTDKRKAAFRGLLIHNYNHIF